MKQGNLSPYKKEKNKNRNYKSIHRGHQSKES